MPKILVCLLLTLLPAVGVAAANVDEPKTLMQEREGFSTKLIDEGVKPTGLPPCQPPSGTRWERLKYKAPAGELWAYVLKPKSPKEKKAPAMVLFEGGFGGIGSSNWSHRRYAVHFAEEGMVVVVPSYRGQHDNPGRFEMFFGEVSDAVAAVDFARALPEVDPDRVYVSGHSSGGTMALMVALASDKVRAAFALGPTDEIDGYLGAGENSRCPFPRQDERERRLRSPIHFLPTLRTPVFAVEGRGGNDTALESLEKLARERDLPFRGFILEGADHFDIVDPINKLFAQKAARDTGPKCGIELSGAEVLTAYQRRKPIFAIPDPGADQTLLTVSDRASARFQANIASGKFDPKIESVRIVIGEDLELEMRRIAKDEVSSRDRMAEIAGMTFVMGPLTRALAKGMVIDWDPAEGWILINVNER